MIASLPLCRAQVMGTAPSSPLSPSPFPICRQEPSQAVRSDASSFFSKLDSHPAPLLLLPPAALPTAASHSRTAASHRGIDSSRLAVPCTEPGRPQLGVAEPGQPWPGHGIIRPAASTPRRPLHLNLGLLLVDEQPGHLLVTPDRGRRFLRPVSRGRRRRGES